MPLAPDAVFGAFHFHGHLGFYMTKDELLAALKPAPAPFTTGGVTVLLRPLRYDDRSALLAWHAGHGGEPGSGLVLRRKLAAAGLCDEAGNAVLTEADVDALDASAVEAISTEVARRNGLIGGDDAGAAT